MQILAKLDRRTLTSGCFGVAIGAALTGGVWTVVSWESKPSFRHTPDYDLCLAYGRSTAACDASMRLLIAQRELDRRNREREICLAKAGDNLFAKMDCESGFKPAPVGQKPSQ